MRFMPKRFGTYFDFLEAQDKRTRFIITLAVFGVLLFLVIAISIPFGNIILRQFFPKDLASAAEASKVEPESSTLAGSVSVGSDSTATGGQYIQFGSTPGGSTGTTYYIDCGDGLDTNNGTSETTPWRNLSKANGAQLQAGARLLLLRGCIWNETLTASWSGTDTNPILISAYGTGISPTIQTNVNNSSAVKVTGSYITIENIYAVAIAPGTEPGCSNNPKGHVDGFDLESSSNHITIRNSKASGGYAGVYIKEGSNNNHILNNIFENNNMMSPLDTASGNDAGAFGMLLWGNDNEIAYNAISGSDACSYDYTRDGSAIEVYNGSRNTVHHNTATSSDAFSELGKDSSHTSADNTFAYNSFISSNTNSLFLNTRGSGTFGPVYRTRAYNNSAYLTGSQSQGVVCSGCASDILTLKNNILWANWKAIYASAAFDESNNIYWKTGGSPLIQGFTISSTSKKVDPQFVSAGTGDLHLQSTSPAVNAGVNVGYTSDLDGKPVPQGLAPDIGAYEL